MKKTFTLLLTTLSLLFITMNSRATVVYTQVNITADQTSTWMWFEWIPDVDGFGLWVNPGASLRIETYGDAVIGTEENGNVFLSAVPYETSIGSGSAWQVPASAIYINDSTHADLNGTTFYAGFQLTSAEGETFYGWMQLAVADDGLSFTLIDMAYEDVAGEPILAGVVERQVMYGSQMFTEDLLTNDGHIMNTIALELVGVNFATTGTLTENTHFTTENVPAGLTLGIEATDATNAVMTLSGQAEAHALADTVNNLTVTFLDAAFDGVPASEITNANNPQLFVKYFGEYALYYEDLPDPVCEVSGWVPIENPYFENYFGIWHDGTDMRLETYGKDVIGEVSGTKSFVTPLDVDTPINEQSAWVASGAWPNESYLTSISYTNWLGQDKYAGLQLVLGDAVMYGWVHLGVSADGTAITVYEWAFNSKPGEQIKAGQKDNTGIFEGTDALSLSVYPNPCADMLNIRIGEQMTGGKVMVTDLLGQTVVDATNIPSDQKTMQLDISQLPAGIYIVDLSSNETHYVQKIIKN